MLCDHVGVRRRESVDKRHLADYYVPKCDKMCQNFERLSAIKTVMFAREVLLQSFSYIFITPAITNNYAVM